MEIGREYKRRQSPCRPTGSTMYFTLKMEAARSFKTLVSYNITIWCHNPEDHHKNLKSHIYSYFSTGSSMS
jgi:hypothetical protein